MSDISQENIVITDSTVNTNVMIDTPVKKIRSRKVKDGEKSKSISKMWNVPNKNDHHWSQTAFLSHIYSLIKELAPKLLEVEKVRDEFNNLVTFLSKFTDENFTTEFTDDSYMRKPFRYETLYENMRSDDERRRSCRCNTYCLCSYIFNSVLGGYENIDDYLNSSDKVLDDEWQDRNYNIMNEVNDEWIKFWNIIKPDLWEPLKKAYTENEYKLNIKRLKECQNLLTTIDSNIEKTINSIRNIAEKKISNIRKMADKKISNLEQSTEKKIYDITNDAKELREYYVNEINYILKLCSD